MRREHDFLTEFGDTTFTSWYGVLRWAWRLEWFQQDWKWCPPADAESQRELVAMGLSPHLLREMT